MMLTPSMGMCKRMQYVHIQHMNSQDEIERLSVRPVVAMEHMTRCSPCRIIVVRGMMGLAILLLRVALSMGVIVFNMRNIIASMMDDTEITKPRTQERRGG